MEESLVVEKLMNVDKELHLIIEELRTKKHKKALSLEELRELFSCNLKSDIDPTKLIRKMRDREYGL